MHEYSQKATIWFKRSQNMTLKVIYDRIISSKSSTPSVTDSNNYNNNNKLDFYSLIDHSCY